MNFDQQLKAVIMFTGPENCGLFSRIKQVEGLISSRNERNIAMDKARFVFIKNSDDLIRNDFQIQVHERGSDGDTSRDMSWKVEHKFHECKHLYTVPDRMFIEKFSNYNVNQLNGKYSRKKIGGQPRCYKHEPKNLDCCKEAKKNKNRIRCDDHNGWDCCGMNNNARISQFPVHIKREFVMSGSMCINIEDKKLNKDLSKW